jgi:hypothetical protein
LWSIELLGLSLRSGQAPQQLMNIGLPEDKELLQYKSQLEQSEGLIELSRCDRDWLHK